MHEGRLNLNQCLGQLSKVFQMHTAGLNQALNYQHLGMEEG